MILTFEQFSTKAQSIVDGRIIYPPEFSPLVACRPRPEDPPLVPKTKFVKHDNRIPNHYIVVLKDDVVPSDITLEARRELIREIANAHAKAHNGIVYYIYEAALTGYSIELPNESDAKALSEDPQVRWVEEDAVGTWTGPVPLVPRENKVQQDQPAKQPKTEIVPCGSKGSGP
jgi:hypothetical protein